MKLAISNIGWTNEEEGAVAETLVALGVDSIEIAPTKRWQDPTRVNESEIKDYKKWWQSYGISVVAFQSMLFNRPDLKLFESTENRYDTLHYLQDFIVMAGKMGAKTMVFGSPKNRQLQGIDISEASKIGKEFFASLAAVACKNNLDFCIEPNAPQYACDFITTAAEGNEFVKSVNAKGFSLHLDIACMALAGDDVEKAIIDGAPYLKHFHISSPMLEQVEDRPDVPHAKAAAALRTIGYEGFVSIEMRPGEPGTNVERVKKAVTFAQSMYV